MKKVENFKIGDEVRWFYQISERHKPEHDEKVFIGSEIINNTLVRIDRKNVEGGYVHVDELFETESI